MIPENYRDLLNTTALVHVATIGCAGRRGDPRRGRTPMRYIMVISNSVT